MDDNSFRNKERHPIFEGNLVQKIEEKFSRNESYSTKKKKIGSF